VRDPKKSNTGTFDARSDAFGVGDPKPTGVAQGAGTLNGGSHGSMPYVSRTQEWGKAPTIAKADRLVVRATNVSSATVDTQRARLSCAPQLDVVSDGPLDLRLACPPIRPASCNGRVTIRLPRVRGRRIATVIVTRRNHRVARVHGRNLRRVTIGRVSPGAFSLRIYLHAKRKGQRVRRVIVVRRIARC
jgi:hypothetical protein